MTLQVGERNMRELLLGCCGGFGRRLLITGDDIAAGLHVYPATDIAKMEAAFALFVCVTQICLPQITPSKARPIPKPAPLPKLFAVSMQRIIRMMKLTTGMSINRIHHHGRPTILHQM